MAVADQPVHAEVLAAGYDARNRAEVAAMAFLVGYSAETFKAYRRDLTSYFAFCQEEGLDPLTAQRPHIELSARWLEDLGRAQTTVANRMSTVCCWYRYMAVEGVIARDVAAHVRRPKRP